jgi:hypothetical protein
MYEKPKENPNKQNSIYSKIKDPYQNYKSMNSTIPMPYTHSINFNIPNANPSIPYFAQTPIPMNPIAHMPMVPVEMPFGHPLYTPYQPDINKNYEVKISTGDLGNIKHIYQDMLPKNVSNHPDRYATVTERFNIANYYGLIFNKHYNHYNYSDELKVLLKNKKDINERNLSYLLGHIKVNNFNSYYKGPSLIEDLVNAPNNFIMYNVCFPIKYDNNQLTCAEDSLRAHIRIYKLFNIETKETNEEIALNKVFFELLYYKKIQDLIRKYKYPNFVLLYGVILTECNIDFNNMEYFKNLKNLSRVQNNTNVLNKHDCLLMLTESVNYNIIQWASKQYDIPENDKKNKKNKNHNNNNNFYVSTVISTGVRSVEAWKSVIFQLLVAIYILDIEKIGFKNFSLKDNVFIKKIDITPPVIKYWKYIIGGTEYYVPNHGFLVMIDSNFTDNNDVVIDKAKKNHINPTDTNTYDYDKNGDIVINKIIKDIFENLNDLKTFPDVTIPDGLPDIFNNIIKSTASTASTLLKDIIYENFKSYLYEKLGHMIQESELNEYNLDHNKDFKVGDLVFYKKYSSVYIISTYKKKKRNSHEIYTNKSDLNNYKEDSIKLDSVKVSEDLITKFHYKSNKEVIETYYIK